MGNAHKITGQRLNGEIMKTNLQKLRKAAGFKSAKEFAKHIGMSLGTYTDYEQGRRDFALDRAWQFADIFKCSLDELAGRESPAPTYADPDQEELNDCWGVLDPTRRSALLVQARDGAVAMRGGGADTASDAGARAG